MQNAICSLWTEQAKVIGHTIQFFIHISFVNETPEIGLWWKILTDERMW